MSIISVATATDVPLNVRNAADATVAPGSQTGGPDAGDATVSSPPNAPAAPPAVTASSVDAATLLAAQEATDARGLTKEEAEQVSELKSEDGKVRRHERAHATAAGPYGGMPQFEFVQGPDGKYYAVSGEVKIDASPGKDPATTIQKMEVIIRAALAPVDPSAQDRAVATQAKQLLAQASAELTKEKINEQTGQEDFLFKSKGLSLTNILDAYARNAEAFAKPKNPQPAQKLIA